MTGPASAPSELPTVGVLGLGLIGGSLAKACEVRGHAVAGWSRSEATRAAAAADGLSVVDTIAEVVAHADVIVLATPLSALAATMDAVADAVGGRAELPTITDVGSVKASIVEHARRVLPDSTMFVPGHPMAGTEHTGWAHADPSLFEGAAWALVVDEPVDLARWVAVARLVLGLGARVVPVAAADHDAAVALVSHLPYVVAGGLTDLLAAEDTGLASALAAGSFRSATRVTAGDGRALGAELVRANATAVLRRIDQLQQWLSAFAADVEADDVAGIGAAFGVGSVPPPLWASTVTGSIDRAALLAAGADGLAVTEVSIEGDQFTAAGHRPVNGGSA